jgi:hypothetical protein
MLTSRPENTSRSVRSPPSAATAFRHFSSAQFMCTAKHRNPRTSPLHGSRHGLRIDAAGFSYLRGPDPSDVGTFMSAEALDNAIFLGAPGVYVALGHCAEALRIMEALHGPESWLKELYKAGKLESAAGVVSQGQQSAIVSQLNSETERLKRDTEPMKRSPSTRLTESRIELPANQAGLFCASQERGLNRCGGASSAPPISAAPDLPDLLLTFQCCRR